MAGASQQLPLVSIGFPLYRSNRFLDNIIENIEAIRYPNVEILISDRHSLDDAVDTLQRRYGDDRRFRFFKGTDELDWVGNFNFLLRESRGTYFCCMAHDDSFPALFVEELVSVLENRLDVAFAFGRVEQLSVDGWLPTFPSTPPPIANQEPWTLSSSLRLLTLWHLWIAYRGMVRREVIEQRNLYMRPTYRNIRADINWVFGLSLASRLLYVPSCWYTKRFYRSSTGADWRFGLRQSLDAFRVLSSYLTDYSRSRLDALIGKFVVFWWCIVQGILPAPAARQLGIVVRRALLAGRPPD
jgi:glycosyltransferase involved in cell wall biosynthesis